MQKEFDLSNYSGRALKGAGVESFSYALELTIKTKKNNPLIYVGQKNEENYFIYVKESIHESLLKM